MNDCIIGIGSNMDADIFIPRAIGLLAQHVKVTGVSAMVKTKPIGITTQADFTNGAVSIQTEMNRSELETFLKSLEDQLGRDRSQPRFGPRNIDLDIMVWNKRVVDEDYYTRSFMRDAARELGFADPESPRIY